MKQRIPDLHALARGELRLLTESDRDFGRVAVQLAFAGIELADEHTWRDWMPARAVELWEASMLSLHLKPDGVQWASLDGRSSPRGPTIGAMLADRALLAGQHAKRQSLPCIKVATDLQRSLVTLWEFATWCDLMGIPCPAEMTRVDPTTASAARTTRRPKAAPVASAHYRMADLAQGVVPMSAATIYRMIKAGTFPKQFRVSTGVSAWNKGEVDAWLVAQASPTKPRRKPRN